MTAKTQPAELNVETWVYITFGERTCKLFWYKVASDGSIYVGIADKKPDYVVQGRIESEVFLSGKSFIGKLVRPQKPMNISKISFHPSGKTHVDFDRGIINTNFWEVTEQTFLLAMIFRDISRLPIVKNRKDFTRPSLRIIAKDFGFRDNDSLQCLMMLRPPLDNEIESISNARYVQWAKIYNNFTDARKKSMIVHFILLGKDADGKSQKHTIFIYPNINFTNA